MSYRRASGNPQVRFIHSLPAVHDTASTVCIQIAETYGIGTGLEVKDDVLESEAHVAFEQEENRPDTVKAMRVATLGD